MSSPLGVPDNAMGLKLYKHVGDRLVGCELVMFLNPGAVDTALRRAQISGRVEVGGEIKDHFADIYTDPNTWTETVALDADSYRALKNHWMRCKIERDE